MGDKVPEASNLVSSDAQAPVSDGCEDESQNEDKTLWQAIDLSLRNDDAPVCESRPESNLEDYQYSPLPSTDKTIRLLCIPPADHISDPLVCQMRQVRLNDKPEYAALSYTWGAPVFDHHVICDGRRLAITAHLDAALRRFRTTTWWTLWVDALCIDQTNIPERNYQVSIMKHIYSQALRTFVYLGEPCVFDGEALNLMTSLAQLAQLLEKHSLTELQSRVRDAIIGFIDLWNAGFPGARARTTDLLAGCLPHPQHPAWESMQSIFSSPWFGRIWIIQEVVLSSDVVVMIGEYRFSWELVTKTMQTYTRFGFTLCSVTLSQNATVRQNLLKHMRSVIRLSTHRNDSQYRSLIKLLCSFRACHSSDPRDKVYALVGMANDQGLHQMIPVDYAKSVEAVYLECAEFLVRNGDGMEMLEQAGSLPPRDDTSVGLSMPSWVPDWSRAMLTPIKRQEDRYRAAGETQPDMGFETRGIGLHVRGIRIDVIDALAPILDVYECQGGFQPHDLAAWEQAVIEVARRSRFFSEQIWVQLHDLASLEQAVREGARISRSIPKERVDDYYKACSLNSDKIVADNDFNYLGSTTVNGYYVGSAACTAFHHRFCVTRQGYMGWAPAFSQPGDLVIVLYGGPMPFTIRETNGGYLLLGISYLEGFMYGEALNLEDAEPEDFLLK